MDMRTNFPSGFGVRKEIKVQSPLAMFIVFGVFLLVGMVAFSGGIQSWNKAEESRRWPTVNGTVISSEVSTNRSRSSNSSGSTHTSITYGAEVIYKYSFKNEEYRSNKIEMMNGSSSDYSMADRIVRFYKPGTPVKVYVNLQNPSEAVLKPGAGFGQIIFIVLGIIFSIIGAGGLIWTLRKNSPAETNVNAVGDGLSKL